MKVRLEIIESKCRSHYHKKGEVFIVEDICPPICHELWHVIYPNVYVLTNNGVLDYGCMKAQKFEARCPDGGRVTIRGEAILSVDTTAPNQTSCHETKNNID
ncbi:TIGR04076 family protein [Fusibacter ferrireducens]|uniref:TIGR04076 family protein n=1 Tax=Fusibacter ferrireducens TaxID=2785058 RepID=A0ABR9ZM40_9FIRM|nr:TIGR04076 family protein [Fusibacter ferrireducens]MBF4691537.1 TIGR04076 family protein [Fusibacter ferrireducens]